MAVHHIFSGTGVLSHLRNEPLLDVAGLVVLNYAVVAASQDTTVAYYLQSIIAILPLSSVICRYLVPVVDLYTLSHTCTR